MVHVAADQILGPISPLIYGLSGVGGTYLADAGVTVNSWGGNPATRYNYQLGYAWNTGADWFYTNVNYTDNEDNDAEKFVRLTHDAGAAVRLAVPTLGWIAKNADLDTCSFPLPGGGCGDAGGASCERPGPIADPTLANVPSTPQMVAAWIADLVDKGLAPEFIAMDNEPELWGVTHYDVHPQCTTYEEILDRYLTYAAALRDVAPEAQFMGPAMCCWYSFWGSAPGPETGAYEEFLPWFLRNVREHDEVFGQRTLDVLDVHYYPQSNVYNQETDPETAARRLRSTRALWDPAYRDESWIRSSIALLPLLRETIADNYPGTALAISEWNFGADESINGALAIADTLGIFGRERLDFATYWRNPPEESPGYFAFKMYGNFDDEGSAFGGLGVVADSPDVDRVGSYAALDEATGRLQIMLVHKDPDHTLPITLALDGFSAAPQAVRYLYAAPDLTAIDRTDLAVAPQKIVLELPAYSITLLVLFPDD